MCRTFAIFLCFITFLVSNAFAVERVLPENKKQMVSYSPLIKKAAPAVVNIYTKKKVAVSSVAPLFKDPFFRNFFGNRLRGPVKEKVESSLGSGVILDKEGYLVTNYHVVSGSQEVTVALSDKREFSAETVLLDKKTDLAVLKIDVGKEHLPYLELVDSDTLEVGDIVFAIGNPFGFDQTVTSGIVSALARTTVGVSDYQFFIQTDAAINPGNSGGALINMDGKLVGINTAIYTRSGGSNGIGFATPSNMVAAVVNSKIENNRVIRPWLGMKMQRVTQEIASSLSMDRPSGVLVAQLYPGGAAEKAGIEVGDVILKVANNEVSDRRIVNFRVAMHRLGSSVPFDILRNGKKKTLLVKMLPPVEEPKRDVRILKGNHPLANTKVANLSPALADELEVGYLSNGVVVLSKEKRIFSRGFGIRRLDIIRSINDKKVNSTRDLERLVKELEVNTSWKLSIERGGKIINMVWRR